MKKNKPIHRLEQHHYDGISALQRYFAKRIKTSNSKDKKALYKKCLGYCNDIKRKAMYSEEERKTLNRFRKNYNIYYDKKVYKNI